MKNQVEVSGAKREDRAPGGGARKEQSLGQRGLAALERYLEAEASGRPDEELQSFLQEAARLYEQALMQLPEDAVGDLAVLHSQLGFVYKEAGDLDRALPHYEKAIRCEEAGGDLLAAADSSFNLAVILARAGRFDPALDHAGEALHRYETTGAPVTAAKTLSLLEEIERAKTPRQ